MIAQMPTTYVTSHDGCRLAVVDTRHDGGSALLLHGLAGHAGEWESTTAWLSSLCQVVAFDQRGHGHSSRRPADLSREAFVVDAIEVIEQLDLAPVIIIGQSLGGHTAFLTAARRPDLVRAVVVAESSPERSPDSRSDVEALLRAWPVPFRDREHAVEFFGREKRSAEVWANGLESRSDGLWPRFDIDVMLDSLTDITRHNYWQDWERIEAETLIVRG